MIAGPIERAGFIDAPDIGPPNKAARNTIVPARILVKILVAFPYTATPKITIINRKVRITYSKND